MKQYHGRSSIGEQHRVEARRDESWGPSVVRACPGGGGLPEGRARAVAKPRLRAAVVERELRDRARQPEDLR